MTSKKTSRLSLDDLKDIETTLLSEPLAVSRLISCLSDFRKCYVMENPLSEVGEIKIEPSPLRDYTHEINAYFGRPLVRPTGFCLISNESIDTESLEFDLQHFLLLREKGKYIPPQKTMMDKIKGVFSPPSLEEKMSAEYFKRLQDKNDYLDAVSKYATFFQELKTIDLVPYHMKFYSTQLPHTNNALLDTFFSTAVNDTLVVEIGHVTYDLETGKVISAKSFTNTS